LASVRTDLESVARQLGSALSDKTNLETLVSTANAKLETIGQNMEALDARNDQLNTAKLNLEEELMKMKADLQDAQEQYTIASRKAKDLEEKVSSLEQQVAEKTERVRNLAQEVEVLRQYYPGEVPTITAAPAVKVYGRITGMSADRSDIYLSIGADDGVTNGMLLIVYKAGGTYAADARVFNVSAGKSAARVIKPVRATIAEGDNVANK
jgi:predicted RNase H-like nuclease (RuvC/YqgF family)